MGFQDRRSDDCPITFVLHFRDSPQGGIRIFTLAMTRNAKPSFPALSTAILVICLSCALIGCSVHAAAPPTAVQMLQKIPAKDAATYPQLAKTKHWPNPYLVIRLDGVGMVTSMAPNEERIVKPEDLLNELAQLPASAWPYGRVVAIMVQEPVSSSPQEKAAVLRNRGLTAGELQGAHVDIEWEQPLGS